MGKRDTNEAWPMDELETVFVETLRKDEAFRDLSPKRQQKMVLRVMKGSVKAFSQDLIDRAPKMLALRRKAQAGFEKRNLRRWREAFELFETVWVCCEEIGRNFNQHFRPEAVQEEDFVFEAMTAVHARSLLVGEEMICLMKGGFPDAAISRWRTLHELTVVAILLSQEGQDLALRYLAHADVQALKGLDAEAITQDEDLRAVKARADFGLSRFGPELEKTYGWACALAGKKQPNFEDLEKKADKGEARYFYKFASQHIHSNHRAHDDLLGMSESQDTMLLVGPSNSGMVGPLALPIGGLDLSVYSQERVSGRGRKRVLLLPPRKRIPDLVAQRVIPAMKTQIEAGATVLRIAIDDQDASFAVTFDPAKGHFNSGSFAAYSAPTIKDDNPLYRALRAKAKQLKGAQGRLGVIVGDGATATLSREYLGPSRLSAQDIAREFLRQHSSMSFVLLLTIREASPRTWTGTPPDRRVEPILITRPDDPDAETMEALFGAAVGEMPKPVMSPLNGALRAQEAEYDTGHHGLYSMNRMTIRMSLRELLEVLAGRRTLADEGAKYVQAARALGRAGEGRLERSFDAKLLRGQLPADIRIIKCGEDDNDDWVEFEFGPPDPAISPLV